MKKYRKFAFCLLAVFSTLSLIPQQIYANEKEVSVTDQKEKESAQATLLLTRLHEIEEMDKSKMSTPEKRQLRKEVRTIKSTLNALGEGVYLSVGAIIIIILLLILLL